jgi:hypothetical protein
MWWRFRVAQDPCVAARFLAPILASAILAVGMWWMWCVGWMPPHGKAADIGQRACFVRVESERRRAADAQSAALVAAAAV